MDARCVIGIRYKGQDHIVFEICVRRDDDRKRSDIYVNYFDGTGKKDMHLSYHDSGQLHWKRRGQYLPFLDPKEPRKLSDFKSSRQQPSQVMEKQNIVTTGIFLNGIADLPPLGPATSPTAVVEVPANPNTSSVNFAVNVTGPDAPRYDSYGSNPIFWRYSITNGCTVEVEAFLETG